MTIPDARPKPREAAAELVVLRHAEELAGWLLQRTHRWPESVRFTLTQRLEQHALDVVEDLVIARYDPRQRLHRLDGVNLVLERLRFLLRLAGQAGACPPKVFEDALRRIDEVGRMLHGWRTRLRGGTA